MESIKAVYAIRHIASGRLYVGRSCRYAHRWWEHRTDLRAGKHHSSRLQNAWNKYGEEAFEFLVIQEIETDDDLVFWEQFWIDKLKPFYNISQSAEDGREPGYKASDETRLKLSLAKLGKKRSLESVERSTAGHRGKKPTPEQIAKRVATRCSKVSYHLMSPTGEIFHVNNMAAFAREHNLSTGLLSLVVNGKAPHHKGWRCCGMSAHDKSIAASADRNYIQSE